jgi:NADPH:quinone reductase
MSESIPARMQAVQQDEAGGKLRVREIGVPWPKAGEVLVRMAAAPINPSDLGTLQGLSYRGERSYPYTPGVEGSGTVVAAGAGFLGRYLKGRRVACSAPQPGNGSWAEYMVTRASSCVPLNKEVSLEQGAMLVVNPLTALAVFEMVKGEKHRAIVNTAAAGALGGMITRLGRRHHIPIIHIVRRAAQVEIVRGRGGEHILLRSSADFEEQLQQLARKLKATLLLDAIGGNMTGILTRAAPHGSTILLYSRLSDKESAVDARVMLVKQLRIQGWFLGNWMWKKNLVQSLRLARQVQSLISADLHSEVHQRLPLAAVQEALESYMADMSAGKVLIVANAGDLDG